MLTRHVFKKTLNNYVKSKFKNTYNALSNLI